MLKSILLPVLGVIVFIALVLAILFHKNIRQSKIFRSKADRVAERAARKKAKEEEYFRRTSTKNYKKEEEKPKFDKDYFKSSDEEPKKEEQPKPEKEEKKTARRTTTTSSGVTIIDERAEQKAERKIFDSGEGEYVEYEEVQG